MRHLVLAAAAATLIAAPGFAFAAAAPAKEKAAPHYDCTKKGNANKAACKTAATTPTAAPAAVAAAPMTKAAPPKAAPMAKNAPAATAAMAPTPVKGGGLKACATQWDGYSQAQKDAYKAKAEGKLSAKGHKLSGYNVFTSECMKK